MNKHESEIRQTCVENTTMLTTSKYIESGKVQLEHQKGTMRKESSLQ